MPGPHNVNLLLGLVAIVAVASTVLSMLALGWVTRRGRGRGLPEHTPPVTVLKPLKGLDEELEANLRSFFHLDYPGTSCSSALPMRVTPRSRSCRS